MSGRQYFERNGLIWGSKLPSTQRFVLLALNDHADQYGQSCYPGQQTLANLTGYNRRTISRALEGLREKGIVAWTTNGRVMATKATNDYEIAFDALQDFQRSKATEAKACDRGSQGGMTEDYKGVASDRGSQPLETEDHNPLRQRITRSTHRSDHGSTHKPPLTPQGGNGVCSFQNSQVEAVGNRQKPISDQQAKQSGNAQKIKRSAARRNETSEQILAALPEHLQARFEKFWKGYSAFCLERKTRVGPKKKAIQTWRSLVESDFNGKGLSTFNEGIRLFHRQQGDSSTGIPHGSKFLFSVQNGSGAWEDAIEQEKHKGSLGDFATSSQSQLYPEFVRPAEDESQYNGPIPDWWRERSQRVGREVLTSA